MFIDLNESKLVKGATYVLKKDRTDTLMSVKFTMPHPKKPFANEWTMNKK